MLLGAKPVPDDQGPEGIETCVRHALGKCVVAAADKRGYDIQQDHAVVALLHAKRKDVYRVNPTEFDNVELLLDDTKRIDGVSKRYATLSRSIPSICISTSLSFGFSQDAAQQGKEYLKYFNSILEGSSNAIVEL